MSTNAVLVKKKGRGIFTILRPFPVGRYFDFYTALSQISLISAFDFLHKASPDVTGYLGFNATGNSLRARPRGNLFITRVHQQMGMTTFYFVAQTFV